MITLLINKFKNCKKAIIQLIFLSLFGVSWGCIYSPTIDQYNIDNYKDLKSNFDSSFLNQFPLVINTSSYQKNFLISNTDTTKNNVGLFLYEYQVDSIRLDSINNFIDNNSIAKYNSQNICLLIVDRFETKYTLENIEMPIIKDSSIIERPCYDTLLPVPNFVNYDGKNKTSCGLDSTFTIYVIEAKPGIYFEKYQHKPFAQMPKKWANGYSKGIAISKKDRTVIYWSIMW